MPSPVRTFFVACHFAALAAIILFGTTLSVVPALASPIPTPVSPLLDSRDLLPRSLSSLTPELPGTPRNLTKKVDLSSRADLLGRDISTVLGNINILNTYINNMNQHAGRLSSQAKTASAQNSDLGQQCGYELSGFKENFSSFQGLFAQLAADKGLANYDPDNALETVLKDLVNANKNALKITTQLVYNIPGLGPVLGPIVYEIKCLLDEVLDAVENTTDALLNAIQPLLAPLIQQASSTACQSGLQILSLCILL